MSFQYSNRQILKGARPDAESYDKLLLLKNVSELRLTYQIRLLTFRASDMKKMLIVQIPKRCKIHASLFDFVREFSNTVRVEKV